MVLDCILILVLSLFKKTRIGRKIYFKQFLKIRNRYGFKVQISRTELASLSKVNIPDIILISNSYLIFIKGLSISWFPFRAIKRFSLGSIIDVEIMSLKFSSLTGKTVSNNSGPKRTKPNPLNAFHRILRMTRVFQFKIFSFKIHGFYTDRNEKLHLSISMRQSLFSFSIIYKNKEVAVNAKVVNTRGSLKSKLTSLLINGIVIPENQFSFSTDVDFSDNSVKLVIDGFADLKKMNVVEIGRFEEYFSSVRMNIAVNADKDKIDIKRGSFIKVDNIIIPVIGGLFKDSWPIFGLIGFVELEEPIIKVIASKLSTKLYSDYTGLKLTLNLVVRFNLLNIEEPDLRISLKSNRDLSEKLLYDFSFLNYSFSHMNVRDSNAKKNIQFLTAESEGFIPLSELGIKIQQLILLAEDPNFYHHRGIDTRLLGISLIHNIKTQKFSKGASTITMQVAKNLLLTTEKTTTRKIEQIVIALLIENVFNITKHRILELYVNLIEFAPNVYGITSGSRFYFSKHPNHLNFTELIVLLYIIPRPIHFYEALLSGSAQLKRNLWEYLNNSFTRAIRNGLLSADDLSHIDHTIHFSEPFGTLELADYVNDNE